MAGGCQYRAASRETQKRLKRITGSFLLPVLRGCGQMLFQPSALTGAAFLALIVSQSPAALAMCLAGVLGATLCAYVLEHPDQAYFRGEGGFNGGLLGLALSVFVEYEPVLLAVCLAGGALTGVLRVALAKALPAPPFTAPFVIVAWIGLPLTAPLLGLDLLDPVPAVGEPVQALGSNASQVLFLRDPWIGALVLGAVLLHSRRAALWVATASLVAWLTTSLAALPAGLAGAGLLGYNGLILAAALEHRRTPAALALIGVVTTVWLSYLFFQLGLAPLSAPFVLSAWSVLGAQALLDRHRRRTGRE